jgi:hypothetical protein
MSARGGIYEGGRFVPMPIAARDVRIDRQRNLYGEPDTSDLVREERNKRRQRQPDAKITRGLVVIDKRPEVTQLSTERDRYNDRPSRSFLISKEKSEAAARARRLETQGRPMDSRLANLEMNA